MKRGDPEVQGAREDSLTLTQLRAMLVPPVDPTSNVLSLVKEAILRQDGLRDAATLRIDDLRKAQAESDSRFLHAQFQFQRELSGVESSRINAITLAESRRIDALLAAATNAVALASEKANAQAATLAQQVSSSAEALRAQVATSAQATTTLITQVAESLGKRLTTVEQNQYQAGGAAVQKKEGREMNQWVVGIVIGFILAMAQIVTHFLFPFMPVSK